MDDRFRNFRQEFSNAYPGDNVKELRFLLHDALSISVLTQKPSLGMNFFTGLKTKGVIAYNNIKIMSEIAELTENTYAKESVLKYIKDVGEHYNDDKEGTRLSLYRTNLYRAMVEVMEDDLNKLIAFYDLVHLDLKNKWDVVFHLEKEMKLNETPKLLTDFTDRLNSTAKSILLGKQVVAEAAGGGKIVSLPTEQRCTGSTGGGEGSSSTTTMMTTITSAAATTARDHPTERQPLAPLNKDFSESDLRELLVDLSDWLKVKGNVYMLKLLLTDFKEIAVAGIQKAKDPFRLFELLMTPGLISRTNIDLIIDIFNVCGWYGAAEVIRKRIPSFERFVTGMPITQLSQLRQNLIEFGRLLDKDKQDKICNWYTIAVEQVVDQWDLLFQLETKHTFKNVGLRKFIDKLERNEMEYEASVLKKGL